MGVADKTAVVPRSEVRRHSSRKSCWIIINNVVYDVTEFLDEHPGGSQLILKYGGRDVTEMFEQLHPAGTLARYINMSQILGPTNPPDDNKSSPGDTPKTISHQKKIKSSAILNLEGFKSAASKILPARSIAFIRSGAEDEYTYNWNQDSWKAVRLRPRALRPITTVKTAITLLGASLSSPFFICPTGGAALAHPQGDIVLARTAAREHVLHWVCNNSAFSASETAAAAREGRAGGVGEAPLFWQVYPKADLRVSEREIREAVKLGYTAFALTVDAVRAGIRERDLRFALAESEAMEDDCDDEDDDEDEDGDLSNGQTVKRPPVWTEFTWETAIRWLRSITSLPIAIKGIQTWEDAALCLKYDNVHPWLSNHGGRQLDTAPSSLDTLLEIRRFCPEVLERREVIVDGGITRGADVVKALALGARAVGLGRPFLFALSLGEPGVRRAIRILKNEVENTMALLGVSSIAELDESYVDASRLAKGVIYLKPRL